MENINSEILLYSIGALVVKLSRCSPVQKYLLRQKIEKFYKIFKILVEYEKNNKKIWEGLKNIVFIEPIAENWRKITQNFEEKWSFKHCIGAIDGKHVNIQALPKFGSTHYNYKGTHPINLLAIADANYKFIMVDIGAPGRMSDSGIFRNSRLGMGFDQNIINVPPPEDNLPYVLVGDEAFPLTNYLMRPYPRRGDLNLHKKVFNYRLSRTRGIVENAFDILVSKWRIFRKPILASEDRVKKIVQGCVCLHNFLIMQTSESENYVSREGVNESVATDGVSDITRAGTNTFGTCAANYRVEWQRQKALNNDY